MFRPLFEREDVIPTFALLETSGRLVDSASYKQRKNLVLVFLHGHECEFCRRMARAFTFFASRYREENAEVLILIPEPLDDARAFKEELNLPFKVLADERGAALAKYVEVSNIEKPLVAVFVTDRFGALVDQWLTSEEEEFPHQERFLTSLMQVEIACPECGIHEWPA